MLTTILMSAALAATPAEKFVHTNPGSVRIPAADGRLLVHASGFSVQTGAATPQEAARAFLATHGDAFGVTPRQALVLAGAPRPGEVGAVRYARTIDGLPVFGGDVVLGVDARNAVFLVNAGGVAASASGRHAIGESRALQAAVVGFHGAGPATVMAGWRAFGNVLRAVYQVDFLARDPAGDWRVLVDGETGTALFRIDLRSRASAPGSVFEVSPVETTASLCPLSGGGPARTF